MNNSTDNNTTLITLDEMFPGVMDYYNGLLYVIIFLGVTGNLLVLAVFRALRPSTSTDWFVVFITITDFVSSVANVPVYVTFTNGLWQRYGSDVICKIHMFISQTVVLSSVFLICGLALDRYTKVCRTANNRRILSTNGARNTCFVICISACILCPPCLFIYGNINGECVGEPTKFYQYIFPYYLFVLLTFITAFVIVVFSYTRISLTVRKSERNVARHTVNFRRRTQNNIRHCHMFPFRKNRIGTLPSSSASDQHKYKTDSNDMFDGATSSSAKADVITASVDVPNTSVSRHRLFKPAPAATNAAIQGQSQTLSSIASISHSQIEEQNTETTANIETTPVPSTVSRQSLRTTKISFCVCAIFTISWIPPWLSLIVLTIPGMRNRGHVQLFALFGKMTYLLNTITNPFVYAWLNRKFRSKTSNILQFWKKL